MSYEVDAIYNNGAFVPVTPLAIPEGVRVHLRVEEQPSQDGTGRSETPPNQSRAAMDEFLRLAADLPLGEVPKEANLMTPPEKSEFLRMMLELPVESPNDGFSGADHDKLLYGQP